MEISLGRDRLLVDATLPSHHALMVDAPHAAVPLQPLHMRREGKGEVGRKAERPE